ncbi:hypothetical protein CANARDRAFT_6107 [[Candida] arabinofermentans NRRL YB-2248]|uniref:Squalene monooxygenase n=1 Tax=[Candida] arabinofermentans NRRL YB-2248 TaxID=983967 RepID=A0A1E4T790_9ASCO|nr:hypothetical protein CANARDRAFT_6107 [[Candida] arabinofermentans NRRL YB-2248]
MSSSAESKEYDVIVIGAGVIGPCIATAMARQGRSVLIVEREWTKPNRIVGELLQPSGLKALKQLGMVQAVNNIDAIHVDGYYIGFYDKNVYVTYPEKSVLKDIDTEPVPKAIFKGDEDKMVTDNTLDMKDWDNTSNVRGVAFHHGDFLMSLRKICLDEPNVTKLEGTVISLLKDGNKVIGVKVADKGEFRSRITISCDGIYSKFRKELGANNVPSVGSYFVGLDLEDAVLPRKNHGHVLLGKMAPVLVYQISPHHTRILCAIRSQKLPKREQVLTYLKDEVLPQLPESIQPSFMKALESDDQDVYKSMPNQYLVAKQNKIPGLICLGDSLNMRHPLTGGGMTVGLNDTVLMAKILSDLSNEELSDDGVILEKMLQFHVDRKGLDTVINTLSIALYSLFAADSKPLSLLQKGCFFYFHRGGECVSGPVGLLSGLIPKPMVLFNHFFAVAFYSCYINFKEKGWLGFPIALWENIVALITAAFVLLPNLFKEIFS